MKRLIKRSYRLLFIVFIGLGLSIGVVYAASTYNAKDIYYHKGSSSLSSDNLQGVIDELYSNSSSNNRLTTYGLYYNSDREEDTSVDFQDVIALSGANVFLQKKGTQVSVCMYYNNKLFCMTPGSDYFEENKAILNTTTFPGATFTSDSYGIDFSVDSFSWEVREDYLQCRDKSKDFYCLAGVASGYCQEA